MPGGVILGDGVRRIGPYAVEAELGHGGTATVFRVRDLRASAQEDLRPSGDLPTSDPAVCALKLLGSLHGDEAGLARFRREFRTLSRLSHPNVLRVLESGVEDGRPWFSMELIDGEDLRALLPQWAALEPNDRFGRVQAVIIQAARALSYVHERGLVHRDVSPGNLVMAHDGTIKLMDFGLVSDGASEEELHGTVAYLAPERIRGEAFDGRADLYALGVVLYQLLTGKKPFQAHTPQGIMERHLHEAPKPPHELDPLVPDVLDRACLRLLAKDPAARFASANHLLHVLGDVEPTVHEGRWPPRLVGRTSYRAWLQDALDDIAAGRQGGALVLTGGPGSGKTRLLNMAEHWASRRGLLVARGRGQPHARPFGAVAAWYEALRDGAESAELRAVFEGSATDVRLERYPVLSAFRELVVRRAPCVLLLDEAQHAAAATRDLIEYVVRNTVELADLAVVVVIAIEGDGEGPIPLLAGCRTAQRIHLPPLVPAEVEELVLGLVPEGPIATALGRRLHAETGGVPTLIAEMLRGLVDEGVLLREGHRWRATIPAEALAERRLPLPDSLRAALAERLTPLDPVARDVARVVALARRALDLDTLADAIGGDESRVYDAVSHLVDAEILLERRSGEVDQVELAHYRLSDVLVDELSEEERRAWHRRLGELLELQHRHARFRVVDELAWHFEQAALPPKAYAYLLEAARKHLGGSSYEEGLYHLERARRMEVEARPLMLLDEADRRLANLHMDRARALFHLGQWDRALEASVEASKLADLVRDPQLISQAALEQGRVLRNMSRLDEAEQLLERALSAADEAGIPALRLFPLYHLAALRWSHNNLEAAERLWSEALSLAREQEEPAAEAQVYNGLGILAFCRGQSAEARRLWERSAELFDRLGMVESLAVARVNLVELYKLTGQLAKALRMADRTVARARELRHSHGIALGLTWRSRVLLTLGRHDEARRNAQEALRLSMEIGAKDEQVLGLRTVVELLLASGMGRFALARVEGLLELLRVADTEGVLPQVRAAQARCLIARGDAAGAARVLESSAGEASFPHIQVRAELEAAVAWRELGRPELARPHLERLLSVARLASFRLYEMAAWQELERVSDDEAERADCHGKAVALQRTVAGSLERADAESFATVGAGAGRR